MEGSTANMVQSEVKKGGRQLFIRKGDCKVQRVGPRRKGSSLIKKDHARALSQKVESASSSGLNKTKPQMRLQDPDSSRGKYPSGNYALRLGTGNQLDFKRGPQAGGKIQFSRTRPKRTTRGERSPKKRRF